jgi:hypothetical protein
MDPSTPTGFNEQQNWGGTTFRQTPDTNQTVTTGQTGLVSGGPQSHAGILASTSDDLFHPIHNNSIPSFPYTLPDVPFHQNRPLNTAYIPSFPHIPVNRDHLSHPPLPPHNFPVHSSSSYNNPNFTIPQPHFIPTDRIASHSPTQFRSPPFVHQHIQNQQSQQNQQNFPPVQYIYYVPQPSSLPNSPSSHVSRTLPNVSHIPILSSKSDFFAWDEAATSLLRANGLFGHILDSSHVPDPSRPDMIANAMPTLPISPSPDDLASLTRWWDDDNVAQHILTSRIGSVPRGLLPLPNLVARTALSIYQTLVCYYGTSNFADCAELFHSLTNLSCQPGRVQEYISRWRSGISRLISHSVSNCQSASLFVDYLSRRLSPLSGQPYLLILLGLEIRIMADL